MSGGPYSPPPPYGPTPVYPPDPTPISPPPPPPPVVVEQCLGCFHRSTTTCDICGGQLGTPPLPPCAACPNGLRIA